MRNCLSTFVWVVMISFAVNVSAQSLVERADASDYPHAKRTGLSRVTRDEQGNVTRLLLNDMQLSTADFEELASMEQLGALVLYGTNVTDEDLHHLVHFPKLYHLNLTKTEVTDEAIDSILEMKHLRSICLGDVKITPVAIERLKERNRTSEQRLRWGYTQREE